MKNFEKRRKCLSLIIALLMVFSCVPGVAFAGTEADVEAPTISLDTLSVDRQEATIGDEVKFSLGILDDSSGINRAEIYFDAPVTGNTEVVHLSFNEENSLYEGSLKITDDTEAGLWKISFIYVEDNSGNDDYIHASSSDLSCANFTVYGTSADTEKPNIDYSCLKVSNDNVTNGETTTISVYVTDNVEIYYVIIVLVAPITGNTKVYQMKYNSIDDLYYIDLPITEDWEEGIWQIKYIGARDESKNELNLYNSNVQAYGTHADLSAGDFSVYGTDADVIAPIVDLDKLTVSNVNVVSGDTVTLSVKTTDEGKGINSVYIQYRSPQTSKLQGHYLSYNEETGMYEGSFAITDSWQIGVWALAVLSVTDLAGNETRLYPSETDLSAGSFIVCKDETAPEYMEGTLNVTNKIVTAEENLEISLKAKDDFGISNAKIAYQKPVSNEEYIFKLKEREDVYFTDFQVSEYSEPGNWVIKYIVLEDRFSNTTTLYNSEIYDDNAIDLSAGDFTVIGTEIDSATPEVDLSSITINRGKINVGTDYVASVDVNDSQSGVASVKVNYIEPDSNDVYSIELTKASGDTYTGTISADYLSTHLGEWKALSIEAVDNAGNKSVIEEEIDALSFESVDMYIGVPTVSGVTVYETNTTVSNQTIYGDVYIGPNAIVTLSNTTVYGNIYVLGGLRFISSTATGVYGRSFSVGYGTTFYNGTIYWSGTCSIGTMVASSYPVSNIPYYIHNGTAISVDGVLQLQGSTINIAPLFVNDTLVNVNEDGKFYVDDIDIGDADTITLKWVTVFGNAITKTVSVDKYVESTDGVIHHKPILETIDGTLNINSEYNLLDYVVATDEEDGDITENVVVDTGDFDVTKRGKYEIKYTITDSNGATATATSTITVVDPKVTAVKLLEDVIAVDCNVEGIQLTADVTTQDDFEYEMDWTSSDENIASINQSGYVTIKSVGQITITVEAGGVSTACTINIQHSWNDEYVIDKESTCTEEGYKSIHCSKCDATKDVTTIEKLDHSYGEWIIDKEPTCTETGSKHKECNCGDIITEILSATGHNWDTDYTVDKKATCTEEGSKSIHCTKCDATKDVTRIEKLTHSYNDWIIDKEPTCTETGSKHKECNCGDIIVEEIAAIGHDFESVVTAPTCTEDGYTTYTCKNDAKHTYVDDYVDASGHNMIAHAAVSTTCENAGNIAYYTCDECGKYFLDENGATETTAGAVVIVATGHNYGTYITTTKAKFGKNGVQTATCSICNGTATKLIASPKTVKLSTTSYTYNGKIKRPTVTVYDSKGKKISKSNYTVSYASGRKNVGKYKVTVTFKNSSKNYANSSKYTTFRINPKGTSISKLTKAKKAFTVKWKKQSSKMAKSRITGYQVRYSTSSKMTNAKKATVKGYSKTSKKITKLKAKRTYYVQVRTYKTVKGVKYYSGWSKVKKVKTK